MLTQSALCVGEVTHLRKHPQRHFLRQSLAMTLLDLSQLELLQQLPFWSAKHPALVRFRRDDYLQPEIADLSQAVQQQLQTAGITPAPNGKIYLLTQLRSWGYSFNPVSFYFCYDQQQNLYAIVAEITNTPWLERHAYVLEVDPKSDPAKGLEFKFAKVFHVSPFMPMTIDYHWRFKLRQDKISVSMNLVKQDQVIFNANMQLEQRPLTKRTALQSCFQFPMQCARSVLNIYWHALILWWKKTPYFRHPHKGVSPSAHAKITAFSKPLSSGDSHVD